VIGHRGRNKRDMRGANGVYLSHRGKGTFSQEKRNLGNRGIRLKKRQNRGEVIRNHEGEKGKSRAAPSKNGGTSGRSGRKKAPRTIIRQTKEKAKSMVKKKKEGHHTLSADQEEGDPCARCPRAPQGNIVERGVAKPHIGTRTDSWRRWEKHASGRKRERGNSGPGSKVYR